MKIILKGTVTAINADNTPSIEITHARINDLNHPWKLKEELFIEIDVKLSDIILPSEIQKRHKEDLKEANKPSKCCECIKDGFAERCVYYRLGQEENCPIQ